MKAESTENYNLEFNSRTEIVKQEIRDKGTEKSWRTINIIHRLFWTFVFPETIIFFYDSQT